MNEHTEADRRLFVLDEEQWEEFEVALGRPPVFKPRLAALLNECASALRALTEKEQDRG